MKKIIIALLAVVSLGLFVVACSKNNETPTETSTETETVSASETVSETPAETPTKQVRE